MIVLSECIVDGQLPTHFTISVQADFYVSKTISCESLPKPTIQFVYNQTGLFSKLGNLNLAIHLAIKLYNLSNYVVREPI